MKLMQAAWVIQVALLGQRMFAFLLPSRPFLHLGGIVGEHVEDPGLVGIRHGQSLARLPTHKNRPGCTLESGS